MKKLCWFALAFILVSLRKDQIPENTDYAAIITAENMATDLKVLAGDEMEGRETAKDGQKVAAKYIATAFKTFGIPAQASGNYYQDVPLVAYIPGNGTLSDGNTTWSFGPDLYYTSGIDDGKTAAKSLVFADYGIQDSAMKWTDYDNLDVKGKFVMIIAEEPKNKKERSRFTGTKDLSTWSTQRRRKINLAKKKGAAALLIVLPDYDKAFRENQHYIESPTLKLACPGWPDCVYREDADQRNIPVLYISSKTADAILKKAGRTETIDAIRKLASKGTQRRFESQLPLTINIQRKGNILHSENVLGYIEGSDLKDELVIITAHYDHLGKDSTVVFNGADDDGSGTVAVINLAKAFAKAKADGHGPRRSILFMAVTGEEKGLLGSKWYTDHPVYPLANTVCDLNIDMIGRVDDAHMNAEKYIYVIGSEMLSSELKKIIIANNEANDQLTLDFRYDDPNDPNSYYTRSDHYNFARKGIPVAFFFNGVHADYHKETDEVSKINFKLMELRARLVFYSAWEIANRNQRLIIDKEQK